MLRKLRNLASCFMSRSDEQSSETNNPNSNSENKENTPIGDQLDSLAESLAECNMDDTEDKPDSPEVEVADSIMGMLDLPCEIRTKIWQCFNRSEIKILRQVCSTIQRDIDYILALDAILDGSMNNFLWIQQVTLNSLTVQCLEITIASPFLRVPYLLRKLVIIQGYVPTSNIHVLLQDLANLSEITFSISSVGHTNMPHSVMSLADIPQVLQRVTGNRNLKTLNFTLAAVTALGPAIKHKIEYQPVRYGIKLKHLRVGFPDIWENKIMLNYWQSFLQTQDRLETFSSNLGFMSWEFYTQVLSQCSATLTRVALYDIQCSIRGEREIFNWNIFSEFPNLTSFKLLAKQRNMGPVEYLENVNFFSFPLRKLTELSLNYVVLGEGAMDQIFDKGFQLEVLNLQFFRNPITTLFGLIRRVIPSRRFEKIVICDRRPLFEIQDIPKHMLHDVCERSFYSSQWTPQFYETQYAYMQLHRSVKRSKSGDVYPRPSQSNPLI